MTKQKELLPSQTIAAASNGDVDAINAVDELGNLIKPDYITESFPRLLERHGMRRIRFHDLRHTSASLLLSRGVPLKDIQLWLGHSDFSTTANTYAHLDSSSKKASLEALAGVVHF